MNLGTSGWRKRIDANGRRIYRTDRVRRLKAMQRRDELREAGLCINGKLHGKATHGVRCEACYMVHSKSAAR